jgi:hypothetical protein
MPKTVIMNKKIRYNSGRKPHSEAKNPLIDIIIPESPQIRRLAEAFEQSDCIYIKVKQRVISPPGEGPYVPCHL